MKEYWSENEALLEAATRIGMEQADVYKAWKQRRYIMAWVKCQTRVLTILQKFDIIRAYSRGFGNPNSGLYDGKGKR